MTEISPRKTSKKDNYGDQLRKKRADELGLGDVSWAVITAFHIENLRIFYARVLNLPPTATWKEIASLYKEYEERWLENMRNHRAEQKLLDEKKTQTKTCPD